MNVAQVGDSAVISIVGSFNGLVFFWQAIDTPEWNLEHVYPRLSISTSVAQVGDSAVIAAADDGGGLWFYWQALDTAQWHCEQVALGPIF